MVTAEDALTTSTFHVPVVTVPKLEVAVIVTVCSPALANTWLVVRPVAVAVRPVEVAPSANVHWYWLIEPPASLAVTAKFAAVPATVTGGPVIEACGAACCAVPGGATKTHCSPRLHTSEAQVLRVMSVSYCTVVLLVPRKSPFTRLTVPSAFTAVTMPTWSA